MAPKGKMPIMKPWCNMSSRDHSPDTVQTALQTQICTHSPPRMALHKQPCKQTCDPPALHKQPYTHSPAHTDMHPADLFTRTCLCTHSPTRQPCTNPCKQTLHKHVTEPCNLHPAALHRQPSTSSSAVTTAGQSPSQQPDQHPHLTICCCCCSQVHHLLLEGCWSDRVLALPGCGPALSSSMEVVWVGPRARMGISEAIPSRVVPHTTSGRADYFGPLVNRYTPNITKGSHLPRMISLEVS